MTEQEAIDWCEQFRDNIVMTGVKKEKYTLALKAMRTAITALKKQIPQKPRVDENDWYCCRNCGDTFSLINMVNNRNKYCGKCGQALDWENRQLSIFRRKERQWLVNKF